MDKMFNKAISDGNWKDLWISAKNSLLEDKHPIIKNLNAINEKDLSDFVKVRNSIVHAGRKIFTIKDWEGFISVLESFIQNIMVLLQA